MKTVADLAADVDTRLKLDDWYQPRYLHFMAQSLMTDGSIEALMMGRRLEDTELLSECIIGVPIASAIVFQEWYQINTARSTNMIRMARNLAEGGVGIDVIQIDVSRDASGRRIHFEFRMGTPVIYFQYEADAVVFAMAITS